MMRRFRALLRRPVWVFVLLWSVALLFYFMVGLLWLT